MRGLFMLLEFRVVLVMVIVGLCLYVTLESAVKDIERSHGRKEGQPSADEELFLDDKGNHIYYDRSLIEKQRFIKKNPAVSPSALRTFRRLISELFLKH